MIHGSLNSGDNNNNNDDDDDDDDDDDGSGITPQIYNQIQ